MSVGEQSGWKFPSTSHTLPKKKKKKKRKFPAIKTSGKSTEDGERSWGLGAAHSRGSQPAPAPRSSSFIALSQLLAGLPCKAQDPLGKAFSGPPECLGTLLALSPGQINRPGEGFGIRGVMKVFSPSELPSGCPKQSLGCRVGIQTQIFWNRTLAPLSPEEALESGSENQDFLPLPGYFYPYSLHPGLGGGSARQRWDSLCRAPLPAGTQQSSRSPSEGRTGSS